MDLLDELKKALGLEDDHDLNETLKNSPLMVKPPPETWNARYLDENKRLRPASDLEGAKAMAEASDVVRKQRLEDAGVDEPTGKVMPPDDAFDEETGPDRSNLDRLGLEPAPPKKWQASYLDENNDLQPAEDLHGAKTMADASTMLRERAAGGHNRPENDVLDRAKTHLAGRGGGSRKAELMAAIDRAGKAPEEGESDDAAAPPQAQPAKTLADRHPEGGSTGMTGLVTQLAMGATNDPRTERLREALRKSEHMKELSRRITGMGHGADRVEGGPSRGDQGKGLSDAADDVVNAEVMPTRYEQANQKFEDDRARSAQDLRLRESGEERAQHGEQRAESGEQRAGAAEGRNQRTFDTNMADTDAKSETSKNARASVESLYPAAWHRIPQEIRDNYSAKDVMRIFGELKQPTGAGTGPSKQSRMQDMFDDRQLVDFEKNLVQPGTVDAYKRIAGRLEDRRPLIGMSAGAKTLHNSLDMLPAVASMMVPGGGFAANGLGDKIGKYADNALRGLTPEGQALYQDAIRVMQQITLDTTGKAMNESELENIKARLGLNVGDENAFRDSLRKEMGAAKERAERQLQARNPRMQKMARERGITPDWTPRGGGAVGYARDAEGNGTD